MSDNKATGMLASSDYKLGAVFLLTSTGQSVDLSSVMLELNIFEDLFSPCMTGDIVLADAADLLSNFQMHGNEFISIQVDKPSLNKPIKKVFRIYKMGNRSLGTTALQNYTLYFASEEMLLSNQILISKSYKGLQITTMAKDILSNKLQVSPTKMGQFSASIGSFDLIVPKMQPFQALSWLANKAYTKNGNLFFFFENRDGYNFVSYEDLLKQPHYQTYQRNVKLTQDPDKNINGFNLLHINQDFDIIKATRFGAYSSSLYSLDLVNRTFTRVPYGYDQTKSDALLNKQAPVNDFKNRLGFGLNGAKDNMVKYVITNDSDPTSNPADQEFWIPQTIARLGQIQTFRATMAVPGDVLLKTGMVVDVILPKMMVQDKATEKDAFRSGSYLISAVHHKFTADLMTTIVELLSDSVNSKLAPAASEPGLTRIKSL